MRLRLAFRAVTSEPVAVAQAGIQARHMDHSTLHHHKAGVGRLQQQGQQWLQGWLVGQNRLDHRGRLTARQVGAELRKLARGHYRAAGVTQTQPPQPLIHSVSNHSVFSSWCLKQVVSQAGRDTKEPKEGLARPWSVAGSDTVVLCFSH